MCASPAESPRDLAVHLTGEGGWPAEQGGHPGRLRTRTTPLMLLMSFAIMGSLRPTPGGVGRWWQWPRVEQHPAAPTAAATTVEVAAETEAGTGPRAGRKSRRIPWSELLKRTFGLELLRCARCGGKRQFLAVMTDLASGPIHSEASGPASLRRSKWLIPPFGGCSTQHCVGPP